MKGLLQLSGYFRHTNTFVRSRTDVLLFYPLDQTKHLHHHLLKPYPIHRLLRAILRLLNRSFPFHWPRKPSPRRPIKSVSKSLLLSLRSRAPPLVELTHEPCRRLHPSISTPCLFINRWRSGRELLTCIVVSVVDAHPQKFPKLHEIKWHLSQ